MKQTVEPDQQEIRRNLAEYSPFYRQSLLFTEDDRVETFIHVSHLDSNTEEALKKIEAFDLDNKFLRKKIIFANLQWAEGSQSGGGHWNVIVKDPIAYCARNLLVAGDGKCGFVSAVLMSSEICKDDDDGWKAFFDKHFEKISRPQYRKDESGDDIYVCNAFQHEVSQQLVARLRENKEEIDLIAQISTKHQQRIIDLLTMERQDFLSADEVHEILTANRFYEYSLKQGKVKDLSNQNAIRMSAPNFEASNIYSVLPFTLSKTGSLDEGLCLDRNKTLKSEFRNIVLNIVHENIHNLDFDTDLESLVKEKLGKEFTGKIKIELGGRIDFDTLFPIDEVDQSIVRGFYTEKMNSQSKTALEKTLDIFAHYSELPFSNRNIQRDLRNVRAFKSVYEQVKQINVLSDGVLFDYANQLFEGKEVILESMGAQAPTVTWSDYSSNGGQSKQVQSLQYQIGPLLEPRREEPRQGESKEMQWLAQVSNCLDSIVNTINIFDKKDENSKIHGSGTPGVNPKATEFQNIFQVISSLCCCVNRRD